jgi:general secretion pathway protein F/type IV pilus assembly protein PilC
MATFQYTARSAAGDQVVGVVQADSESAVVRSLDERQLYPISVTEQRAARREGKVRLRDVGTAYGQLSDLMKAGVPLLRSLETIARAGVKPGVQRVLLQLRDEVSGGDALADAMAKQGDIFPGLHVAMVKAGEKAGFLEDVMANLSRFIERIDELRSKVRGAMIYPTLLVSIGGIVITGLLVWFVPQFKALLAGAQLPLPTRIMFGLSDILREHYVALLAGVGLAAAGLASLVKSPRGKLVWERYRLRAPLMGRVLRTVSIARFCRILGTMLANGVPILTSLGISKDATGSAVLAQSIEKAAESVRAGDTLAGPLRESGLFPPDILEMIAVAEESNQLEKVLVEIADTVERRTDRQVDQAVRLLEPLILVFLAVIIGVVAFGLIYPVLTMAKSLH